jgi:threonine dehydrogenase-like Zn-dependent dehydrogenase
MKALQINGVGVSALCEVPRAEPGPGEVLVKVAYVGLCGSDLNTFRGANPLAGFPRIPGHEVSGVIAARGPDVLEDLALGQPVIIWPYSACGACTSCRRGRAYACRSNQTLGVQRDGALREEMVLPASAVIANDTLPSRLQVLVEPLSVGFHAAARGSVSAGDTVVVLGAGMIGIGAIAAAAARGARVISVDPIAAKRDIALAMGAGHFTSATGAALLAEITELTGGDGADVVIEAVGVPETFTGAIDLAAFCGRVVYVGYAKAPVTYDTKFFNLKELDIFGSRNASRRDFEQVISTLERIGAVAERLITQELPLSAAADALPFWEKNRNDVLKMVIAV